MNAIVANMLKDYRTTSPYGKRIDPITGSNAYHSGVDLVKGNRQPIYAFVPGTVVHARMGVTGSGFGGYGNVVAIRDKNGNVHLYAHLDSISVQEKEIVLTGEAVGTQGATGRATGSHLHYEVRINGVLHSHVEPINYLQNYYKGESALEVKVAQMGNVRIKMGDKEFQGVVIDGVSYAPVRAVADAIGKAVEWDAQTKTAEIK